MVLPQNSEVNIWGWANPNEEIKIKAEWDTITYTTTTGNRTAKWKIKIKTPKFGGPYKITINGSNRIVLEDVMIGEVWLCGGQSNMEASANRGIKQAQEEAPNATNAMIRFFYVPKSSSMYPQEDTKGKWVVCTLRK
jgi:sialate O-acetylesterase